MAVAREGRRQAELVDEAGAARPLAALRALHHPEAEPEPRPQVSLPAKSTDPLLREVCLHRVSKEPVECLMVAQTGPPSVDERGARGPILDRLQIELGETPAHTRFIPYGLETGDRPSRARGQRLPDQPRGGFALANWVGDIGRLFSLSPGAVTRSNG